MELTRESHLEPAKRHLSDRHVYAPVEVFAAMTALEDPESVQASLAESRRGQDGTTWRVAWLSKTRVTFCEANRPDHSDWSLELGQAVGQVALVVDAWTVPLSNMSALAVTDVRAGSSGFGGSVAADVVWSVSVTGGRGFTVPLFGDFAHHAVADDVEGFVLALRSAWASSD